MLEEGCEKSPPTFKLICSVLPPRFGVTLFYGTVSFFPLSRPQIVSLSQFFLCVAGPSLLTGEGGGSGRAWS
jgi:hypothetical protein